jgi:hypothetical protein
MAFPTRPDSNGVERIEVRGRLDVNGGLALREAALAGLGAIFQPPRFLEEGDKTHRLRWHVRDA